MLEIKQLIPCNSHLLAGLHDENFRPTIAPNSLPVHKGRILFEQNGPATDFATVVRAPICLLSEGDTDLLRRIDNPEEGLTVLKTISSNSPTAAVLFDAYKHIKSNPTIAWFSEDSFFANTVSGAIGLSPGVLLPIFQSQANNTAELLSRLAGSKGMRTKVRQFSFSNIEVQQAIAEAIHLASQKLGYQSKDRKKLKGSSAAIVGATHALFPLINSLLSNSNELTAVQGPIHLETIPPHWITNTALSTVIRFVNQAAADWQLCHRTLMPCLYNGEPIGEFSAFDVNGDSPQLRRDQRYKLALWAKLSPFPLTTNAVFGHAIGLMEDCAVAENMKTLIEAERTDETTIGIQVHELLAAQIDDYLSSIKFWK
ncbi:hypothetical protein COW57_04085 [Candidatus Roizmanbacteria bacterium CG17_big_fil_post_rev_8_21_14_2_50_39_7]|uniref:Uncharacterized protein n=2 Tax=Candidatus Roizmaniibacteriota TaxID=1752723 RepID=A0A2H0KJ75_9BACT|nr:MAG: hypothetical protein COV87_04035 [Candidatus Roizmanbacteria bacterium CG11_big_fil_rev_8_21_14_0_20_37_16]PIV70656.1 MAG: hypothetical protein COW57_04085 [Candidatus Roizmanbacteria bacterium CG17_big_fil_post_rev_8_21_14_2_50_39_7]